MKLILSAICLFLLSCASNTPNVKHTLVIKGIKGDNNTPTEFSLKVYDLQAGPDLGCGNLTTYRRFGTNGKYQEFFANSGVIIASARPATEGVYSCVTIDVSAEVSLRCPGENTKEIVATLTLSNSDNVGNIENVGTGPDGHTRLRLKFPFNIDTKNPKDLYIVASGLTNCLPNPSVTLQLTDVSPSP